MTTSDSSTTVNGIVAALEDSSSIQVESKHVGPPG
jgi:hypothetical protein